jgi:hypothetical protein
MKLFSCLALLAGLGLLMASCSKTTTLPTGGVPSGSTTISLYTPELESGIDVSGGVASAVQLLIDTDTKVVDYAAVTLTGPSALSLPLTFSYSTSGGGYFSAYYYSTSWTYQANQTYTLTISYDSHTYKASVKSVGNVQFTPGSSALTITWQGGGNENTASAMELSPYNSYNYGPNLTSPYVIQQSNLADYPNGSYNIYVDLDELTYGNFSGGAYVASFFNASDQESYTY